LVITQSRDRFDSTRSEETLRAWARFTWSLQIGKRRKAPLYLIEPFG